MAGVLETFFCYFASFTWGQVDIILHTPTGVIFEPQIPSQHREPPDVARPLWVPAGDFNRVCFLSLPGMKTQVVCCMYVCIL